ncbi:MAG: hypothetical protein EXR71_04645 [Myxococcales bacterium]|nr:hypothetical protein [Myxococcales bacterium]
MSLLLALACVKSDPLPDVGACAVYPEGSYEFGQLGIGTCLAGPTSLTMLADGHTLAVTNANPFLDFTGGSLLTLDLDLFDEAAGRVLVSDLDPHALALPQFAGGAAYAAPYDLLLVASRLSDGARTREQADAILFVDVSNPDAPALATDVGSSAGGSALSVGWDPVDVVYDQTTDRAWTVNRTDHTVTTVDLASRPARVVPPGGDGRLVADEFVDVDGSGSRAAFARLTLGDEPTEIEPDHWDLSWNAATVRAWIATDGGLVRQTGNGENTWVGSGVAHDVPAAEGLTTRDPAFRLSYDGVVTAELYYADAGSLSYAYEDEQGGGEWLDGGLALEPTEAEVALADPFVVVEGGVSYLYYTAGEGQTWVGVATQDGGNYRAVGAVLTHPTGSVSDVSVLWDEQIGRWRAWYAVTDGGEPVLSTAYSDDLRTWTVEESSGLVAYAPSVSWWSGRFHLYRSLADGSAIIEATSVDGHTWTERGVTLTGAADAHLLDGVAVQVADEASFGMQDSEGAGYQYAIAPGTIYSQTQQHWFFEVATGQLLGPEDLGDDGAGGVEVSSWVGDDVWADVVGDDGVIRIGHGAYVGGLLTVDSVLAFDVGAADAFDADGVHDAVVVELDGGWTAFYAGDAAQITSIGRAVSVDGLNWTRSPDPVHAPELEWEGATVVPGSAQVLEDGTLRLWYAGEFGEIGALDSADGGVTFAAVPGAVYPWAFDTGAPGTWYDSAVSDPYVIRDGDLDRMWFTGDDGEGRQLGYAERVVGEADWIVSEDADGNARPAFAVLGGALGSEGLSRPVVRVTAAGFELLYGGIDAGESRVGRAYGREADRFHRDLALPTIADTWGFTVVPANDAVAISLDTALNPELARGCMTMALDEAAGMLYVGCKLVPYVYVLDVRDDSSESWSDLNYLGVEAIMTLALSSSSGVRDLMIDPGTGTLYGLVDEPEAIVVIRADDVVDDQGTDDLRQRVLGLLPLPRSFERDVGVETQSAVGPAQMVLHPDGIHLFVTNFNNDSVSVIDLSLGPLGTLVAQTDNVGENPYAMMLTPDGARLVVANYLGEVDGYVSSTLVVLDADPSSATFLDALGWVVNR